MTVSLQGDYGKPRPALIVQSDLLTDLESVVLCPVTSDLRNAAFRVTVEPNPANGLRALSQVMVDKLSTLPRTKRHCCKVSDEAAFCLIQRPYISKTLLTRRISPRGSP
ncbi:type II toxin-antitoxin system PemK/MazF family toxin [Klebsiella pneumoniae]|nr:type II toxin-antitoxin system PemK/MazF family toxin [Klebsiella pneumoniae]